MWKKYVIGIDESGRGPWAGPVVAGGWMAESSLAPGLLDSLAWLTDSKMLTPDQRETLYHEIERMQHRDECQYAFSYRDADVIDAIGIREANRQCMQDVLLSLLQFTTDDDMIEIDIDGCDNYEFDVGDIAYIFAVKKKRWVKKDSPITVSSTESSLSAEYVIGGDRLIPAISAASIIAKVTHDRMMCDFHEDFPMYGFDTHKGYGTSRHREAILNYGITPLHRKSYEPMKSLILASTSI
jgi:ribonuclease HII